MRPGPGNLMAVKHMSFRAGCGCHSCERREKSLSQAQAWEANVEQRNQIEVLGKAGLVTRMPSMVRCCMFTLLYRAIEEGRPSG
jgi:hypothetical protein